MMAVLGWGSLIWDAQHPKAQEFDKYIDKWLRCGPRLQIEFAKKSRTRSNALTLVIDRTVGTEVQTLYAISKRTDQWDVVCDLRNREGTTVVTLAM